MRATHQKTADFLTTEKSLTGKCNFMAGRGYFKLIVPAKAAYFVATCSHTMKQNLNIKKIEIDSKFQLQSIEWLLNASSASHFGGTWERLVSVITQVFLLNLVSNRLSRAEMIKQITKL